MLIDFHTHIFPEKIAEYAIGKISETATLPNYTNGTIADTLGKMDGWKVDKSVVLHIATKPSQQTSVNNFAKEINSDRLISFGSIHPDSGTALEELQRIHDMGLRGVKFHPDYQDFFIDDPKMDPLYDMCSQLGLVTVFHAGFDPVSPNVIHTPPARSAAVARRFPHLKMVLAHFGGNRIWDQVEEYLVGTSVFFDTAFSAGNLTKETAFRLIRKHGAEKILFGSDCPWQKATDTFAFIDSLPLTESEKEQIFSKNAQTLLGI